MSLQVCHCGWSKVTTYHGLRTHQGKMGCTTKGMRFEASKEQHMWGKVGFTPNPKDLMLDDYTSFTTDPTDFYPDTSLQVCHCGWSKVTTYHGLRTHQGKMGCTPKGMRIPKKEQYDWANQWEEVDQRKRQPAKRMTIKKENSPSPPSANIHTYSATIKEEHKLHVASSQPLSTRTAIKSKARHQLDFSSGVQVNRSVRERPTPTYPVTVAGPKEKDRKHQTLSQVNGLAKERPAIPPRVTVVEAKEKERNYQQLQAKTLDMERPTATYPAAVVNTGKEHREDQTFSQVKELARMFSDTTAQETVVRPKGKRIQELSQVRQDRITADFKHKAQMREQNVAQGRSSVKACMDSLDAEWLEINGVFSEVMRVVEEAKQRSPDLSFSIGTLRATTSTMMEQIHQKLGKLSSIELTWTSKFAVDVKLDPTTAHRCLVSGDGKEVSNRRVNQGAPGRFGSVLGLNRLTLGKSYWEVVVSNKTGWYLGVARRDANRKGKLSLNPGNGYWVAVHYEGEKYAAMAAPPVRLPLKEKPEKVGVFVDYEEGLVSFYDVTARSHIYSFTGCSFGGEIYPYFSLQLQEDVGSADPLIISSVKHQ